VTVASSRVRIRPRPVSEGQLEGRCGGVGIGAEGCGPMGNQPGTMRSEANSRSAVEAARDNRKRQSAMQKRTRKTRKQAEETPTAA